MGHGRKRRAGSSGESRLLLDGLDIRRWVHGGDGMGVPEGGPLAGAVVFVPDTVPGDRVSARILRRKRRWARGRLVQLEHPSPDRVEPACPVQGQGGCGGCPWMVGSREAQARARLEILRGEAAKTALDPALAEGEGIGLAPSAGPDLGYRARVRLAWRREGPGAPVELGYRAARSRRLVAIESCPVAAPAINDALPELRETIAGARSASGEVTVIAGVEGISARFVGDDGATWLPGRPTVGVEVGGRRQEASPAAFLQANPAVAAQMSALVERWARRVGGRHAVELFAGSGGLTTALLAAGYEVEAYESAPEAVDIFIQNTVGQGEARWHRSDLFAIGVPLPAPAEPPDVILLDPPRTGAATLVPWMRAAGAAAILLISCDVATGFRDLAALEAPGEGSSYAVVEVVGFDMFPHTGHQELAALCVRA